MYKDASRRRSLVSNSSARMKKMAAPQPPPSFPSSIGSHEVMTSHHSSDDCAINELLEGRMELDVILPDNRKVRMSVERRTPMMDLLVQATTANKINPGGHVIHMWKGKSGDLVHYKPNTPIGSLDSHTIYIVHKSSVIDPPMKKMPKLANKPFEQTFRLQVNLPRNQLMVLRVSPKTCLSEVKQMACTEKRLDPSKYQLVHPNRLSKVLDLSMSLLDYGANEVTLMSVSNIQANICNSATDFIAFTAHDEEKKKKGILSIFSKRKNKGSTGGSSEDGPNSRAVSPCRPQENVSRIGTKKRPAPLPPQIRTNHARSEAVSHSRHSSDSSGYHESSVFSDSPETSSGSGMSSLDSTDSHVNGKHTNGISKISVSQQMPVKKRKAPPPPVPIPKAEPISNASTTRAESPVDASPEYDEEEVLFPLSDARRASISSLGTIDDIENSFEQTIAEAQRVIDMEEEQRKKAAISSQEQEKIATVGKTDVVALQARLEQDISQQKLQSEIATVFTSVHLQIKDSKEDTKSTESELSTGSQEEPKETLILPVFSQKHNEITTSEESGDEVFERQNYTVRKKTRPKAKRQQKSNEDATKHIDNFTIGSYRGTKDSTHIKTTERKTEHASLQRQGNSKKALSKSESFNVSREEWIKVHPRKSGYGGPGVRIGSFLDRSSKKKPNDNKVYGLEGSVRGIKGQVKLRCAEITDLGFSPVLKEKSRSMLNLIPEHKENIEVEISIEPEEKSLPDDVSIKRALSEHNLSNIGISAAKEQKSEFAKEQERLQCEYMKLEKQFVAWQQQLVSNHTLLEKERILPSSPSKRSSQREDYKDKPILFPNGIKPTRAVLRARESQSLTRRPKSELLSNITLSTWDSQKGTEYLTLPAKVTTQNSYGIKNSDKKIDIDATDFQVKAKQASNSLRSSITKTYFKPPEVRSSSHTRQRLPPEVRTEDENPLVKTDSEKERSSRRDNFQKNTCETASTRNHDSFIGSSWKGKSKEYIRSRDIKTVKASLDTNLRNKQVNESCSKESVPSYTYFGGSANNSYYLGLEPQKHNYLESWSTKESQQRNEGDKKDIKEESTVTNNSTSIVPPPPPPPPMPTELSVKQLNTTKGAERKRVVQTSTVDPREELMIEVRKFGGRSGLRKVSNPEASWQLTVFGSSVHH